MVSTGIAVTAKTKLSCNYTADKARQRVLYPWGRTTMQSEGGGMMKYKFEHEFPGDMKTVLEAMFAQGVTETLAPEMTTLIEAETKSWSRSGDRVTRKVRYLPVPKIKSVGPKTVEPKWMEWIEESDADLGRGTVKYKNVPSNYKIAELLRNSGEMTFEARGGKVVRVITGELNVKVFLVGVVAERVIAAYAKEILDDEARVLKGRLARGV